MRWRRLRILWRAWLRADQPRQRPGPWRRRDSAAVLLGCLLVALVASWPWLVQPNLQAGAPAPFTVRAPRAARVIDSAALEQRREQMLPRTTVQVVDDQANQALRAQLDADLLELERLASDRQRRVEPIALTAEERAWLQQLNPLAQTRWQRDLRQAQLRMLSQGLAPGLAEGQLLAAARLQLDGLPPRPGSWVPGCWPRRCRGRATCAATRCSASGGWRP